MQYIELTQKQFDDLPEYSLSLPTGTTLGKRWKRNLNAGTGKPPDWRIGEFIYCPDEQFVNIVWKKLKPSAPMPTRIQLRRTKGWKKPEGAVVVSRPGKWGNPFPANVVTGITREKSIAMFRQYIEQKMRAYNPNVMPQYRGLNIAELRGKDLCCWCGLDQPCHADVLIELANA